MTDDTSDFVTRHIKKASIEQLQAAFEKALKELTGASYDVDIRKLDLDPEHVLNAWITDTCDIAMRIQLARDSDTPF
jgi:hypothetical protein